LLQIVIGMAHSVARVALSPKRVTFLPYVRNITNIKHVFVTFISLEMYCYLFNYPVMCLWYFTLLVLLNNK